MPSVSRFSKISKESNTRSSLEKQSQACRAALMTRYLPSPMQYDDDQDHANLHLHGAGNLSFTFMIPQKTRRTSKTTSWCPPGRLWAWRATRPRSRACSAASWWPSSSSGWSATTVTALRSIPTGWGPRPRWGPCGAWCIGDGRYSTLLACRADNYNDDVNIRHFHWCQRQSWLINMVCFFKTRDIPILTCGYCLTLGLSTTK